LPSPSAPTRRFAAGQTITDVDLDGSLTLTDRVRLGQIAAPPAPKAGKKDAAPAADQAETPAT
jgi:hypothetical protein